MVFSDLISVDAPAIFLEKDERCYYKNRFYLVDYSPLLWGMGKYSEKLIKDLKGSDKSVVNIIGSTAILEDKILLYVTDSRLIFVSNKGISILRLLNISKFYFENGILSICLLDGTVHKLVYKGKCIGNLIDILSVLKENLKE